MHRALLCGAAVVLVLGACAGDDGSTEESSDESPATADRSDETVESTAEPSTPPATTDAGEPAPDGRDYDFSAIGPIVQEFIGERELNGAGLIIVHRDDGVIHHEHWGEFDADRISLVASSSKMIAAGVLLRLQDDGLLDVDAPVADAVDWGGGNPDITPAQLVSNSSGLVGLLDNPAYRAYACQFLTTGSLQECARTIFSTPDDDGDISRPDEEFRYGGAQWQVAGAVAEAVSGKSWAELIDEIYVQPCGLDALGFNNHFSQVGTFGFDYPRDFDADPSKLVSTANPNIEGGAYVTTGDYGKLLLMHLRDGMCEGGRVLSPEALAIAHADRVAEAYDGDAYESDTGYGFGWWIDRDTGRLSDGGAYGSVPWLDLADGYGAYLVIEADSGTGSELAGRLYDVVDEAVAAGDG